MKVFPSNKVSQILCLFVLALCMYYAVLYAKGQYEVYKREEAYKVAAADIDSYCDGDVLRPFSGPKEGYKFIAHIVPTAFPEEAKKCPFALSTRYLDVVCRSGKMAVVRCIKKDPPLFYGDIR